jgi:hypothetical protein
MAKRPEFRVAPDKHENSGEQEAGRPNKSRRGPALSQSALEQHEQTGKCDE